MSGRADSRPEADGTHDRPPEPGRRAALLLGVVLLLCTAGSLAWSVQDFWEPRADATRYLLAARSLADGEGYTIFGAPFRLRPPGFSVLLAPVVGRFGYDFAVLNLYVSGFGIAAVLLLYGLLLPRVGAPLAFGSALLVWLNPQFQKLCNLVMSDVPGLAAALLALLVLRWANHRPGLARDALVGVAIAAAIYLRSANALLLPALALDRLSRWWVARGAAASAGPGPFVVRRVLPPIAIAALLYAPWSLQPSAPRPSHAEPWLRTYATALLRRDAHDAGSPLLGPAGWLARIESNGRAYAAAFASGMSHTRAEGRTWPVVGLGLLGLLATLARRREAPEWFALGTLVLLLLYFEPAIRLLLPVFVLTVGAGVDALRRLGTRLVPAPLAEGAVAVLLLLVTLASFRADFMARRGRETYADLLAVTRRLRETVPPDAPLGGDVGPMYALLLDRPVQSLRPLLHRRDRRTLERALDERGLVAAVARDKGRVAAVLRARAEAGARLETIGGFIVVYFAEPPPSPG